MKRESMEWQRFSRSAERRTQECPGHANHRNNERRTAGIDTIPLFRNAAPAAVLDALSDSEVLLLTPGTPLLRPGEINHNVYILLSGEMAAYLDANLSQESAIRITSGECIGELSAIDDKPVSALVLALTDARLLMMSQEVFWYRVMALPAVARNLMISLTERMRRTNEQTLKAQREQLELVHLRKELDVARQLQISMLPLQRPLFQERSDIEVCGFMEPASDVGGDLFDAFFVDENRLFFCIGDVSGHGIAAALFMARAIGLLRILAMNTLQPDKLLETLNNRLCIDNDTNIFITMFCGFLDLESGILRYSNGGHCAPIISRGNEMEFLRIPRGPLIGAFPGVGYTALEHTLGKGELLFCYTDGVTEAQSLGGEEFSEDRCLGFIGQSGSPSLPELLDCIRREVSSFTATDLLDDDCTMLAIRRPGEFALQ